MDIFCDRKTLSFLMLGATLYFLCCSSPIEMH